MIGLLPGHAAPPVPRARRRCRLGVVTCERIRQPPLMLPTPRDRSPTPPSPDGLAPTRNRSAARSKPPCPSSCSSLEVGLDLLNMVDATRGGELLKRIASLRKQLAGELGIIVPAVHIRDDLRMRPGAYRVLLSGVTIAEAEVFVHRVLAIDPTRHRARASCPARRPTEPTFGLPAKWLSPSERARAEAAGCTVVDAAAVIATHLTELIRRNAHDLLGRRELQDLLDVAGKQNAKVVEELIPTLLPMGTVIQVLRKLLAEGVSIRDLRTILEALADHAPATKNADDLIEMVRQRLARRLTRGQLAADGCAAPARPRPARRADAARRRRQAHPRSHQAHRGPREPRARPRDARRAAATRRRSRPPPHHTAWGWVSPSAARSSRRMGGGCGPRITRTQEPHSASRYRVVLLHHEPRHIHNLRGR